MKAIRTLSIPLSEEAKSLLLFVGKTLIIFFTLKVLYLGYIAAVDPTSSHYFSDQFAKFSLLEIIRKSLLIPTYYIIKVLGFYTYYSNKSLFIDYIEVLRINNSCLGVEVMIAFFALVVSFPDKLRSKITNLISGLLIIYALNLLRMVLVARSYYESHTLGSWSHDLFNYSAYAFIIFFIYKKFSKSGLSISNE